MSEHDLVDEEDIKEGGFDEKSLLLGKCSYAIKTMN